MDEIDRAIIETLLADGRATYARIGQQVGLSVAASKRRVDRLVSDQVIRGFTAVVDPAVLGWQLEAQIRVFTNGAIPFARMRADLEKLPEIEEAYTVAGSADAVVQVVAADAAHLERVISTIRDLDYVQQTDTTLLLSALIPRRVGNTGAPASALIS
jgi:DNA-binding Lrp family transcriptional regulator